MQENFYQSMFPFEHRLDIANKIMDKKPHHFPIILIPVKSLKLSKYKMLAPKDINVAVFMQSIKKCMIDQPLNSGQAIFIFTETMEALPGSLFMGHVYETYKNDDKHLYIYVDVESVFGTLINTKFKN